LSLLSQRDYLLKGVLPVLGAAIVWAFAYLIRKAILVNMTPISLAAINAIIASIVFLIIFRPSLKHLSDTFRAHLWLFVSLAFTGCACGMALMFYALSYLDLGTTTLLEKLQPIFTLLLAALFLKEKVPRKLFPFCVLAILSSYFIVAPKPLAFAFTPEKLIGIACALGAGFFWAVSTITGRALMKSGLKPWEVAFFRFLIGFFMLLPVFLWEGGPQAALAYSPGLWAAIILTSIISTVGGFLLYYQGLKHVTAPTATFLEMATPLICVLLGIAFFHETFNWIQGISMLLLLYSVYKISAERY
jgi:drug/metabolite transporter (DMT)-like permease